MRKLKATWTKELYQDLLLYHGIDMRRKYIWVSDNNPIISDACYEDLYSLLKDPLKRNFCLAVWAEAQDANYFYCQFHQIKELTPDVYCLSHTVWKYNHQYERDSFRFIEFDEHILYKDKLYVGFLLSILGPTLDFYWDNHNANTTI